MAKLLGWVLILLGLALIVLNLLKINLPLISQFNILWTIVIGLILIVTGFLFLKQMKRGKQLGEEVPIYQGEKIVGYRRK